MSEEKKVILVRHGDKDNGDNLTVKGIRQIEHITKALKERRTTAEGVPYLPGSFWHSGANRTAQCAAICAMTLFKMGTPFDPRLKIKTEAGLHYEKPFEEAFGKDTEAFRAEVDAISKAGGMVTNALAISQYARNARLQLTEAVLHIAIISEFFVDIGFSHSPLVTLACTVEELDKTPYQVGEAVAVIYTVNTRSKRIISTEIVSEPLAEIE